MARYAAKSIIKKMLQNECDVSRSKVGILGLTFKENCPDIRNTKVADLIVELKSWNVETIVHDPWANNDHVQAEYNITLTSIESFQDLDAIILAVGHDEFRHMAPEKFKQMCNGKKNVMADLKSVFDKKTLEDQGFDVFRL